MASPTKEAISNPTPQWRPIGAAEHAFVVEMCLMLYEEDPGFVVMSAEQIGRTLATFERTPWRGMAVVLDVEGAIAGYALLVRFYSNELGGDVCEIDELFVRSEQRNKGYGTALFRAIDDGAFGKFVGCALGVTPDNDRARRLYERIGFRWAGLTMVRARSK